MTIGNESKHSHLMSHIWGLRQENLSKKGRLMNYEMMIRMTDLSILAQHVLSWVGKIRPVKDKVMICVSLFPSLPWPHPLPPLLSLSFLPCRCGSINKWTPIFPPEWWGSHLCPSFSIFLILSFHPPKAPNVKSHLLSEPTEKGLQWLPALQPHWCGCHCDSASAVMSRWLWLWLTYLWSSDPTVSFQAFISSLPKTFQRPS